MLIPMFLSFCGIAATFYYQRWSEPRTTPVQAAVPIGYVQSVTGFQLRQKSGSLLWAPLQDGDAIFSHDTIKTGQQGEIAIFLPLAGKSLELESDTLVIIEKSGRTLPLKTKEGYLTLRARGVTPTDSLNVQVVDDDGKATDVPSGAISFLKEIGVPIRMIDAGDEKLSSYQNIHWAAPANDSELELNPDSPQDHHFTWTGNSADWKIQLEWGPSRRQMPQKKIAASDVHDISMILPLGKHFWRWSVLDAATEKVLWSSPTSRLLVTGTFPPAVAGPTGNAVLRVESTEANVTLKWVDDKRFDHYQIELASDAQFAQLITKTEPIKSNELNVRPGHYGTFYWRLTGFESQGTRAISTKAHAFKFLPKAVSRIQLQWVTRDQGTQYFVGKNPSLVLKWTVRPSGDRTYRVQIKAIDGELAETIHASVKTNELAVKVERAGVYQAAVEAVNADSDIVGSLAPIEVHVQMQPLLEAPILTEIPNSTAAGQITLQWNKVEGAREYQVELKTPDGRIYNQMPLHNELSLKKLLPGTYDFHVSAIDSFGRASARSPAGKFTVPDKSALKAPKIRKLEVE